MPLGGQKGGLLPPPPFVYYPITLHQKMGACFFSHSNVNSQRISQREYVALLAERCESSF